MGIRQHFSEAGLKLCKTKLDWKIIDKQWRNIVALADTKTNLPYPQINLPKQIKLEDLLDKQKSDRILFVMPGTYGDVFLCTGVVNAIKKKYPTKDIYFCTSGQYSTILDGNPDVYKVLQYDQIFNNIPLMNTLFDQVFTPFTATQMSNNWTRNGYGKHLIDTYAEICGVNANDPYIQVIEYLKPAYDKYAVIHTTTGQEAKNYLEYQKIIDRIDIPVIQVGAITDTLLKNVLDMRGKKIQETAGIINKAELFIGGDSVCAHIAGFLGVKSVLLYGPTFHELTAPRGAHITIIQPENRFGCDRACHLAKCVKSPISCINNIGYETVVEVITQKFGINKKEAPRATISGYITTFNPNKYYPWKQAIKSLLGFCDEVVVVDGLSTDGTLEELQEWKKTEPKLRVVKRRWKFDEPAMDGMMKAYARSLCTKEFCFQIDADEIVHESDYEKIHNLCNILSSNIKVVTLPVLDLYGSNKTVRSDRGLYKVRLSRNLREITHGIPKPFRKTNKQGKIYADPSVSDGCELINSSTLMPIDGHVSFFNNDMFVLQNTNMEGFKKYITEAFKKHPSVWHFSWADLERRIKVDLEFWDDQWKRLNNNQTINEFNRFFPNTPKDQITDDLIKQRAEFLKDKKLDESPMDLITIDWLDIPEIMKG